MTKINTSVSSLNTEFAGRVCPYYKAPGENKDRVVVKSSAALSNLMSFFLMSENQLERTQQVWWHDMRKTSRVRFCWKKMK